MSALLISLRFLAAPAWALVLALAAVLAMTPPARAEGAVVLADSAGDIDAWSAVTMLADPDGSLDAQAALARLPAFSAPQTPHANLGVRRDVVWLHVRMTVPTAESGRWLLDIDYPSLDRIDAYVVSDGRVVKQVVMGDHLSFEERPLASRSHTMPLLLERGLDHDLLLRVQTTSSMIVPLHFLKAENFHARESSVHLVQGLAAGIGLCLLMYALAHWAGSRDPMFLYYAVTIAGTTMFFFAYYGLAPQHLWPGNRWLTDNMAPLAVLVALGGGMLLIERMLDVRAISRWLATALRTAAAAALLSAALFACGLISYRSAHLIGTLLGPLPVALAVRVAWVRMRHGDEAARYIFAGWAVYAVGVGVMAALLRGWLDSNTFTQHAFQAGAMFEMLMWLPVLGVRNNEARDLAATADRERLVMQALAHTDPLTTLPNRRGLEAELAAALPLASAQRVLAVCLIDLDGFKAVNDRLGHDAGDEPLVAVSARLKAHLRHRDVVARLGGDEFVILARDLAGEPDAWALGRKLVDAFKLPFLVQGQTCQVGLTVGFALAPLDGADAQALLRRADAAMYAGKQSGKGTVRRGAASAGLAGV
jgi:diguanylate cyclase (GGDEF)-like protein